MSPPDLRLLLSNRPQNVALVRQALGGLAGAVGLDEGLLADVKTAVSEACNNVVLHAYPGGEGPLEVYVCPDGTQLEIVVRDVGEGIQPRTPEPDEAMHGVGLSLIQALTERVEFVGGVGVGGLEPVLERLSDELVVEPVDGAERLRLRIVDRR